MYRLRNIKSMVNNSDLLRHNLIFFVGTLAIALFNYLYYPILSRLVSVADFGEIQAVISLFMQLGIVLTAFGYVITNIVSNTTTPKESNRVILHLEQLMLLMSILALPVLLIVAQVFSNSFKLHSTLPILLVGILVIINIPATSRTYILQGFRRLKEVSVSGVVYAVGKLILSVGFIYIMTNNVVAAVLGYLVAQIIALIYLQNRLGEQYSPLALTLNLRHIRKLENKYRTLVKKEFIYGMVILAIMSGLTLLYSSDTILARLFFDTHTLGLYSGISSVARIVFFLTASVAGVLIASVKMNATVASNRRILLRSLAIIGVIGGLVLIFFTLLPHITVRLLVGPSYEVAASWLPPLTIVMFLCSLNNLLAIYQIALRRYKTMISVLLGVLVLLVGLFFYHSTIAQFIGVLLAANLTMFVLLSIEIMLEKREKEVASGEGIFISSTPKL